MLGSDTPLALQESRRSMVSIFHAMKTSLDLLGLSFRIGPFGTILINDEYIWENYGIPMLSFSCFPYPEYHSSRDNMEIISEKSAQPNRGCAGWRDRSTGSFSYIPQEI